MADDRGENRGFNFTEAFLFPKLFRGFRIAIDYRKLLLALIAVGLFYGAGVLTDWVGGMVRGPDVVSQGAISEVESFNEPDAVRGTTFEAWRNRAVKQRTRDLSNMLRGAGVGPTVAADREKLAAENVNEAARLLRGKIWEEANKAVEQVEKSQATDVKKAEQKLNIAVGREAGLAMIDATDGQGVFEAFLGYQIERFDYSVKSLAFLPGGGGWPGVWEGVKDMFGAFVWLCVHHWVYAIVLGIVWLGLASVFGGAIARLAAVQAARDEKISAPEALKFSIRKFVSFISAPLIPFVIVAFVFVLTMAPAAASGIPVLGEILIAVLSPLVLVAGFIMALVAIGGIGGMGLMHPTIAVEGSDAFDAISRGFSYVYSRPWRSIFYNGCAIVYGGLCFLFVKLFVFVMLWLTWMVLGALVWGGPAGATDGAITGDKIAAMWAQPTMDNLHSVNWGLLQGWEMVGAIGLSIWVGIVVSLLAAFVVSYAYSSQTLIYLLLRKRVDATDIDDVYIEETEEEELFEAPPEEKKDDAKDDKPAPAAEEGDEKKEDEGASEEGGDEGDKSE